MVFYTPVKFRRFVSIFEFLYSCVIFILYTFVYNCKSPKSDYDIVYISKFIVFLKVINRNGTRHDRNEINNPTIKTYDPTQETMKPAISEFIKYI